MKKHEIPKPILDRVEAELLSNEHLLWVGQPDPLRFLTKPADKTHPLLAVVVTLQLMAFVLAAVTAQIPLMIGLLLSLLVSTVIGSLAQQYLKAKNTIYAITNNRALVIEDNRVVTFSERDLQSIERHMFSAKQGDIILRTEQITRPIPQAFGLMLHKRENKDHGFFAIQNPEYVELLLLENFGVAQSINTQRLEENYDDDLHIESEMYRASESHQ